MTITKGGMRYHHTAMTEWQILAMTKLIRDDLARHADDGDTPYVLGLQQMLTLVDDASSIRVTCPLRLSHVA